MKRGLSEIRSCSKNTFIISYGKFRSNLMVGYRNDVAILFVLGNINSNKVQ